MDNGITKRQLEKHNLNKLIAQRQIYSDAKDRLGIEIISQVILIVFLELLPIILNNNILKLLGIQKMTLTFIIIFSSLLLSLLDLFIIRPSIDNKKSLAAKIQDDYDCSILSIPWNSIKSDRPGEEIIYQYANKFIKKNRNKDFENLKKWYSPESIKTLPLPVARIICQRTNCWWDNFLRNSFIKSTKRCSLILCIVLLLIGLIKGFSLNNFITNIIYPFFPVVTFTCKQIKDNNKSIKLSTRLESKADSLWEKVLSDSSNLNGLDENSRKLQDEIFENRKGCPLIFDWYYNKYKDRQQSSTDYTINGMINKYNHINK